MSQAKIRAALEKHLIAWKNASYPTLKFYPENKKSPTTDALFVTTQLFPDSVLNPSIGGEHKRYSGRYRVVLQHQNIDKGIGATEAIAESLVDWFKRGDIYAQAGQTINIERTPALRPSFIDGMYVVIPVDVFYRSDVIN